jgi:hypothetical protein
MRHVDIQMPIRKGTSVAGSVLQRFSMQDLPCTLYTDATDDFLFTQACEEMVKLTARTPEDEYRIRLSLKAAFKRNKLRLRGDSPYVYLADPDVLLPQRPVFASMVDTLERHPQLGAAGVCYQQNNHIGAGAMMLRRSDFERVGELRGGQKCICNFISARLREFGLYTLGFRTVRATHLKTKCNKGGNKHKVVRHKSADGVLDRKVLEELIEQHGTRFKLFVEMPNA